MDNILRAYLLPLKKNEECRDVIIGSYGECPMKYGRDIGVFIFFLFTIFTASAQDEGKEDALPYKELKKHIPAEYRVLHRIISSILKKLGRDKNDCYIYIYCPIYLFIYYSDSHVDRRENWHSAQSYSRREMG